MFAIGESQDFLMGKFLTGNHKSVCCELCTRFLASALKPEIEIEVQSTTSSKRLLDILTLESGHQYIRADMSETTSAAIQM